VLDSAAITLPVVQAIGRVGCLLAGWLISTFGTNRWPTFNVADSALTVGAFLLLYELFFHHRREKKDDLAPLSD